MITLSLLKLLEDGGFGTIDEDLFWEKIGLDNKGLYITDLGESFERSERPSTMYQLYYRGKSDSDGFKKLEAIVNYLNGQYGKVCTLPAVPPVTADPVENVTIMPLSSISSVGEDGNGRIIWTATGRIYY